MKIIKALYFFSEASRLCVLHGMILMTPAVEIKKMKLRQIENELRTLKIKANQDQSYLKSFKSESGYFDIFYSPLLRVRFSGFCLAIKTAFYTLIIAFRILMNI